jgi:hypothetical protein
MAAFKRILGPLPNGQGCQMVYFYQKSPFGYILNDLGIGNVGYFIAIWCTYFMAIGCILWPLGVFCGHLV